MQSFTPRAARVASTSLRSLTTTSAQITATIRPQLISTLHRSICRPHRAAACLRPFSTSTQLCKGLMPGSEHPEPPNPEEHTTKDMTNVKPAELTESEYHEIADQYINTLVLSMEEMADKDTGKGLEVEYSAGVLTLSHPSKGTYVLNKQPPNKQIWLSSPISGPKRFDWVVQTPNSGGVSSMDHKQDTEGATGTMGDDGSLGGGQWIYLRDGTSLSELLEQEVDVVMAHEGEGDAVQGREGPGGSGSEGKLD